MTQRNNVHTADLRERANAAAAGVGSGVVASVTEASSRVAAPAGRARRGTRMTASLPIEVRDQFGGREEVRTQFLMIRGAVFATSSNVRVGHKLTIQNQKNGRIAECYVIAVEPVVKDVHQIEVEFTRPQPDFWPVQFPVEDSKLSDAGAAHNAQASPGSDTGSLLELQTAKSSISAQRESASASEPQQQLLVLADSVATFNPPPVLHGVDRYSSKTATLDSVAQFRAANRAAHRRQQQMKVFYSFLFLAALGGGFIGWRSWNQSSLDKAQEKPKTSTIAASHPGNTQPAQSPKPQPESLAPSTSASSTPAVSSEMPVAQAPVSAEAPTEQAAIATTESKPQDAQVEVRHGALSTGIRKHTAADEEEEPLALPLKAAGQDASQVKPEVLSSLVAHIPSKAAVLAPQAPKKLVPAKLLHSAAAQYPPVARQMRVEGSVTVEIEIDTHGNVSQAKAVSGAPVLRAAALDAVRSWKYEPAMLGEKPVSSAQSVKIDFRLR